HFKLAEHLLFFIVLFLDIRGILIQRPQKQ
ncbi:MAG: hypothetical protein ACI9NA_000805, partial [Gammaproteobacteria bacterium]